MPAITDQLERRYLYDRHQTRMSDSAEDNSPGVIEGYAAVFYRDGEQETEFELWEGRIIERIAPGAFDDISDNDVRCLFDHISHMILGRSSSKSKTLELKVDDIGLNYRCTLPKTTAGRDVAESISRGDITGSSFQFDVLEQEWKEQDGEPTIRTLTKLRLFDVGPVTFPAYEGTTTGVRSQRAEQDLEAVLMEKRNAERKRLKRRILRSNFAD